MIVWFIDTFGIIDVKKIRLISFHFLILLGTTNNIHLFEESKRILHKYDQEIVLAYGMYKLSEKFFRKVTCQFLIYCARLHRLRACVKI